MRSLVAGESPCGVNGVNCFLCCERCLVFVCCLEPRWHTLYSMARLKGLFHLSFEHHIENSLSFAGSVRYPAGKNTDPVGITAA